MNAVSNWLLDATSATEVRWLFDALGINLHPNSAFQRDHQVLRRLQNRLEWAFRTRELVVLQQSSVDFLTTSPSVSAPNAPPPSAPTGVPAKSKSATPPAQTFIQILVTDKEDNPVADARYRLVLTDGSMREGRLGSDGRIYVPSIPAGVCEVMFFEMTEVGVPDSEVKRSWNWKGSAEETPSFSKGS